MAERSSDELSFLFELCQMAVERMIPLMEEHHISFRRAGSHVGMPDDLRDYLVQTQEKYRYETDKTIVLAFNYGGRDEILRAIQKVASQTDIQTLQTIDAETLSDAMDFG
ncbi:undecaprenyl diphosphate synthase family protein [Patescibacteria group bacterium]|nr:undecaprenyl diphosphate synthase family protein [Patescibacteria group bacterium]